MKSGLNNTWGDKKWCITKLEGQKTNKNILDKLELNFKNFRENKNMSCPIITLSLSQWKTNTLKHTNSNSDSGFISSINNDWLTNFKQVPNLYLLIKEKYWDSSPNYSSTKFLH